MGKFIFDHRPYIKKKILKKKIKFVIYMIYSLKWKFNFFYFWIFEISFLKFPFQYYKYKVKCILYGNFQVFLNFELFIKLFIYICVIIVLEQMQAKENMITFLYTLLLLWEREKSILIYIKIIIISFYFIQPYMYRAFTSFFHYPIPLFYTWWRYYELILGKAIRLILVYRKNTVGIKLKSSKIIFNQTPSIMSQELYWPLISKKYKRLETTCPWAFVKSNFYKT